MFLPENRVTVPTLKDDIMTPGALELLKMKTEDYCRELTFQASQTSDQYVIDALNDLKKEVRSYVEVVSEAVAAD